jgi:hypothetical protein
MVHATANVDEVLDDAVPRKTAIVAPSMFLAHDNPTEQTVQSDSGGWDDSALAALDRCCRIALMHLVRSHGSGDCDHGSSVLVLVLDQIRISGGCRSVFDRDGGRFDAESVERVFEFLVIVLFLFNLVVSHAGRDSGHDLIDELVVGQRGGLFRGHSIWASH